MDPGLWCFASLTSARSCSLCSWVAVEVPRYLFYAFQLFDAVPAALKWYRYSAFYILYPTGITGELVSMLVAAVDLFKTGVRFFLGACTCCISHKQDAHTTTFSTPIS